MFNSISSVNNFLIQGQMECPCFIIILVDALFTGIQYARKMGASALEAYPVDPLKKEVPGVFAFTGLATAFQRAGFREVARNSETRPIVRLTW